MMRRIFSFKSTKVELFGNVKFKEVDFMSHFRLCCGSSHEFDGTGTCWVLSGLGLAHHNSCQLTLIVKRALRGFGTSQHMAFKSHSYPKPLRIHSFFPFSVIHIFNQLPS